MSTILEIETKSLLTKNEYKSIRKNNKSGCIYSQINYYISSDELNSKIEKFGIRIRRKHHKYELTLKVTQDVGRIEINQDISRKTYTNLHYFGIFPDGEVKNYLIENNVCDVSKLKIIGKMKTVRTDINYLTSLVSVDKSIYNGQIDYELECEDVKEGNAKENIEKFLKENDIEYKKSEQTKLARFLNTLK